MENQEQKYNYEGKIIEYEDLKIRLIVRISSSVEDRLLQLILNKNIDKIIEKFKI